MQRTQNGRGEELRDGNGVAQFLHFVCPSTQTINTVMRHCCCWNLNHHRPAIILHTIERESREALLGLTIPQ
jgi:hypothetical protein